jgi:hypothetical protein
MSQAAGLLIDYQHWISAKEQGNDLVVYRSVALRDDDVRFTRLQPVLDRYELVTSETVIDEDMMFGRAEMLVYRIREV